MCLYPLFVEHGLVVFVNHNVTVFALIWNSRPVVIDNRSVVIADLDEDIAPLELRSHLSVHSVVRNELLYNGSGHLLALFL